MEPLTTILITLPLNLLVGLVIGLIWAALIDLIDMKRKD